MNRLAARLIFLPLAAGAPAHAETLQQALLLAYRTSPLLHGQQALQRATEESTVQAEAGWKPQVSLNASGGYVREPYNSIDYGQGSVDSNDTQATLSVTQPLYTGGRVASAVRAAEARAQSGQQGLRLTEAQVVQAVVGAYMDVLRDSAILDIRRTDLDTLRRQVANTTSRFNLGTGVTRTDVAQAETQQDAAEAALAAAQAQLDASRASYAAVVGAAPGQLADPGALPRLPASLLEALNRAQAGNPALAQSQFAARASDADIASARAAAMPSVGVQASVGEIGPASPFHTGQYQQEASALITVTQPLYTGGMIASQVRQAEDRHEADRQAVQAAARAAAQDVRTAWSATQAGLTAIRANQAQVAAAQTALRGYQAEYAYGLRSTLDVLIADENLRAAQVGLAESRHDTTLAEAALLAATGDLQIRALLQDAPP
jgi:outer membrane protein